MRTKTSKEMPEAKMEWPRTVEEAVDRLLSLMSEEDKQSLKNTPEKDLIMCHFSLGAHMLFLKTNILDSTFFMDDLKTEYLLKKYKRCN